MYKRADGIVIIDPEKAVGQKELVQACPYGSIYLNEEKNLPQKCTLCAHLVDDGWKEPRCAQSCPMSCMHFGDLDDPESNIAKFLATAASAEKLHPEYGTKPRVTYVGLPKPHLAGTIRSADAKECTADVTVTLTGPDGQKSECVSDCFGDFQFKNVTLGKSSIAYSAPGYQSQNHAIDLLEDITYVGEVQLQKSN
jgi:NAD-dependent dihydropyrimidine dehydrogenase PreA subunit